MVVFTAHWCSLHELRKEGQLYSSSSRRVSRKLWTVVRDGVLHAAVTRRLGI